MLPRAGILSPRPGPAPLADLAERLPLMARQRVRRRRRGRQALRAAEVLAVALFLGAAGAAVALGLGWLFTSPRFAVAAVEVRGVGRLSTPEILSAAGIAAGENLFRLDPERVAARLRQLPRVRRAHVVRSFPDRVTIVVEERVPFTLAQAGALVWLDEEGVSLGAEPRAVPVRLPVLTGLLPAEAAGGAPSDRARAGIALIRAMLRAGSPLAREVSEIDMSGADGPVLYTLDGVEVRLGGGDWGERLGRLEGVLAQIRSLGQPAEYVDLRFRDQVVFKPRSG